MEKWECSVCGYIYDPADNNNITFNELPKDWKCPECDVLKEKFEKVY